MAILKRVEQRQLNDCQIAMVATVMGPPYTYERVLADYPNYRHPAENGLYSAWWETYLWDGGFPNRYYATSCLHFCKRKEIVGILSLAPKQKGETGHLVVFDELGVINPATNWPERLRDVEDLLGEYRRIVGYDIYTPDDKFLAVWKNRDLRNP